MRGSLAAGAAILALAATARAADEAGTLEVERLPGAESCPDAAALIQRIAELERDTTLVAGARGEGTTHFEVVLERMPEHWRARIVATGAVTGDRTLTDASETCEPLGQAVALTLSMLAESGSEPALPPPALVAAKRPPPVVAPAPPPRTPEPSQRSEPSLTLAASGGPALTIGVLERAGPALWADAELGVVPGFHTTFGVLWAPPQSIDHGPGTVDVSLVALGIGACLELVSTFGVCIMQLGGELRGTGNGYDAYTRSAGRPWLAVGAGARAHGELVGPLGWVASATALAPLTEERFAVEGVPGAAFEPSPLGLLARAGLRLTIW